MSEEPKAADSDFGGAGSIVFYTGALFAYFGCLYGSEYTFNDWVTFVVWIMFVAILAAVIEFALKFIAIVGCIFVIFAIYTDEPWTQEVAEVSKISKLATCALFAEVWPDGPSPSWLCAELAVSE